jgi:type II secretory pathway component GspD/PulD (secretin)
MLTALFISAPILANSPEIAQPPSYSQEKVVHLRNEVGDFPPSTFTFNKLSLDSFVSMFSSRYKVSIINNVVESLPVKTFTIRNSHPADMFNQLITSWGCDWYMKDGIIRVAKVDPVRIFKLNYARVENVVEALPKLGGVTLYPKYNTIVAKGDPTSLDQLEHIIRALDKMPRQVIIEAKIIETSLNLNKSIGVSLGSADRNLDEVGAVYTDGFNRTAGSGEISQGFFVQVLNQDISAKLDALQTNADAKVLANPKLMVTNHNTAHIQAGERLGYRTLTNTNTTTIEQIQFLDTGIKLEITPHISDNDEILMEIEPEVSEGRIENDVPRESKTLTKTEVILGDGQTIAISGLIQKKNTTSVTGVPILSDIPIINWFFQKTDVSDINREIIVLITPRIVEMNMGNQ